MEEFSADIEAEIIDEEHNTDSGISYETAIEGKDVDELMSNLEHLKCENASLQHELSESKKEIESLKRTIEILSWTEESFRNDDKKLAHFTGVSSMPLFLLILSRISDSLSAIKVKRMNNFQKLLLTLMKLRTNASFVGLGYRFGIHNHTAATIFQETIIALEYAFRYVLH